MRASLLLAIVVVPCFAIAAPKKTKPAVPAKPAVASGVPSRGGRLIDSDLGGRDLAFLANAVEEGQMLRFLSEQAARTSNPDLRGFGEDLVKTLAAQSSVLNTVAEMRKIRIGDGQSEAERRIAVKIAGLDGIKLEKVLLDQFREVDRRALATYELGLASEDQTIHELCEQTLPQIREHLAVVDAMAGIAPQRIPSGTVAIEKSLLPAKAAPASAPELPSVAAPPPRPDFRTNVRLPNENAPAAGR